MDPLSIITATITLIQAAGAVSAALHEFVAVFRTADSRVAALSSQLSRLIKFLEAVDGTLKRCHGPFSAISMDADLLRQSELSLEDCRTTLDDLAIFINKIKAVAKSISIFRRAKVAIDLTMYAGDITGFEEKIHKSNWALQTMLSAMQVILSLRGNETQEKIMYELEMLKSSIEQSRRVILRHGDGFSQTLEDPSDRRIVYNLKNLARVAQSFHSSASSTASTIFNGTITGNLQSDAAMSLRGGSNFTHNKRQQIGPWIKQQRRMTLRRKRKPVQQTTNSVAEFTMVRPSSPDQELVSSFEHSHEVESNMSEGGDDDEAEFQSIVLSGLEEVAKDSMLALEFSKAQAMLEEAIQRRTGSTSEDSDFKKLQIQLAFCYFFQHKWHLAEPLIESIAKLKSNFDPIVCNLLHAMAVADFVENRLEKATTVCKQALFGKRRLKRDFAETFETEYNETLSLLAIIHEARGNRLDAEGLRRKISNGFAYSNPENELEFIIKHQKLCSEVFGRQFTLDWKRPQIPATNFGEEEGIYKSDRVSKKPLQTFHTKLDMAERVNSDSAKEVINGDNYFDYNEILHRQCINNTSDSTSISEIFPKRTLSVCLTCYGAEMPFAGRRVVPSPVSCTIDSLPERQGRRFTRILGFLRNLSTTPRESERSTYVESSLRPKLSRRLWRLIPRPRPAEKDTKLYMDSQVWVTNWLRGTPQDYKDFVEATDEVEETPISAYDENHYSNTFEPAEVAGIQIHEMMDTSHPAEIDSTGGRYKGLSRPSSIASHISRVSQIPRESIFPSPCFDTMIPHLNSFSLDGQLISLEFSAESESYGGHLRGISETSLSSEVSGVSESDGGNLRGIETSVSTGRNNATPRRDEDILIYYVSPKPEVLDMSIVSDDDEGGNNFSRGICLPKKVAVLSTTKSQIDEDSIRWVPASHWQDFFPDPTTIKDHVIAPCEEFREQNSSSDLEGLLYTGRSASFVESMAEGERETKKRRVDKIECIERVAPTKTYQLVDEPDATIGGRPTLPKAKAVGELLRLERQMGIGSITNSNLSRKFSWQIPSQESVSTNPEPKSVCPRLKVITSNFKSCSEDNHSVATPDLIRSSGTFSSFSSSTSLATSIPSTVSGHLSQSDLFKKDITDVLEGYGSSPLAQFSLDPSATQFFTGIRDDWESKQLPSGSASPSFNGSWNQSSGVSPSAGYFDIPPSPKQRRGSDIHDQNIRPLVVCPARKPGHYGRRWDKSSASRSVSSMSIKLDTEPEVDRRTNIQRAFQRLGMHLWISKRKISIPAPHTRRTSTGDVIVLSGGPQREAPTKPDVLSQAGKIRVVREMGDEALRPGKREPLWMEAKREMTWEQLYKPDPLLIHFDVEAENPSNRILFPCSKVEVEPKAIHDPEGVACERAPAGLPLKSDRVETSDALSHLPSLTIHQTLKSDHVDDGNPPGPFSDATEPMINRQHPLRARRKRELLKRAELVLLHENRMLDPETTLSLGDMRIGVAF